MPNFSDYIKNKNNTNVTNVKKNQSENSNNQNQESYEKLIDKYSKYSDNELMNEFIKLTIQKKKAGDLSTSELNAIKNTIYPYLNEEQKDNLNKIMTLVDNV